MYKSFIKKEDMKVSVFSGKFKYDSTAAYILRDLCHAKDVRAENGGEDIADDCTYVTYAYVRKGEKCKPFVVTFRWVDDVGCNFTIYNEDDISDYGDRFTSCPSSILHELSPASPGGSKAQWRSRCEAMRHERVRMMDRDFLRSEPHCVG